MFITEIKTFSFQMYEIALNFLHFNILFPGISHGCSLSLILFALVIKTFANVIRYDKLICAICTKDRFEISSFADDTLLTHELSWIG